MRHFSTGELLDIWERGSGLSSSEQAQVILRAAREPARDPDPAQIPLGERDAQLLILREWTFGERVNAVGRCPKCKLEIELTFDISDLRIPARNCPPEITVSTEEYQIKFRLPNSLDLAAIAAENEAAESLQKKLLRCCVTEAIRNGEAVPAESLPESVVSVMSKRMSDLDPQAEIDLQLSCESCGERWNETFDVASFFWTEIHAWAERLLNEIHQLASSYGWSEREILTMSAARRRAYLSLITG